MTPAPEPATPEPATPERAVLEAAALESAVLEPAMLEPAVLEAGAPDGPTSVGRRGPLRVRPSQVVVAAVVLVLLAAVAATAPSGSRAPLDPDSTAPDGTKAMVLLLRDLGASVTVGGVQPRAAHGVALVLTDRLSVGDRARLARWVDAGGVLVVTDPLSPLTGVDADTSTADAITTPAPGRWPGCALLAVRDVHALAGSGSALLRARPGQVGCFPAGRGSLLVARSEGAGTVVVLAGPDPWTNRNLAVADDAELAAALLAPVRGTAVIVVGASPVGGGDKGLLGLVSPHLVEAFWGLIAAFVILVAWRARRLGRPVGDAVAVELPGSGLVAATGNLLQEGGHRHAAARSLRADLRRLLAERLGTALDLEPDTLAAVAAARTGVAPERILAALDGPAPGDDAALVVLAQTIEETRQEISRAR